ncbi:MAG: hypothetical protein KAS60_05460 [Thermoplasmata archaeon]|nr:hypothetical protein [Thermoplasmata archaeon]
MDADRCNSDRANMPSCSILGMANVIGFGITSLHGLLSTQELAQLDKAIVFIIVFALAFTATVMIGLGLAYLTLL